MKLNQQQQSPFHSIEGTNLREQETDGSSEQNSAKIHVSVFNETLQKSNRWIRDIMQESGWSNPQSAYSALRATLHVLRDRLTVEEASDFAAELPILIRGVFYEGWTPTNKPDKTIKTENEFLERIQQHFRNNNQVPALEIVQVVFRVIERHISSGEVKQVLANLPKHIRSLWPRGLESA